MSRIKTVLGALAFWLTGAMPLASAQLEVNISTGVFEPTPIAIPDFEAKGVDPEIASQISEIVRSDLELTGLFVLTPPSAFIQTDVNIEVAPRFADWKIIKSDALVIGSVESVLRDGTELLRGSLRMWDVYGEELMRFEDRVWCLGLGTTFPD